MTSTRQAPSHASPAPDPAAAFRHDHVRLSRSLAVAPGVRPVAAVPVGDRHCGGAATQLVTLSDGSRLIHKPRGVAAHLWFDGVVALTNELVGDLGLRTVAAVPGHAGGWTAHVEAAPTRPGGEVRLHRRFGALLALLHLVRATDVHVENVVVADDHPMLIDLETLFHPRFDRSTDDPAAEALRDSVARTGVLPAVAGRHGIVDVSGLSAAGPAAVDVAAVQDGFAAVHRAVRLHRPRFAALLATASDLPVRVVWRSTRHYAHALSGSRVCPPDEVRDPSGRVHAAELADLRSGDVPLFTTRAGGRELHDSRGAPMGVHVHRSGLGDALDQLARWDGAEQSRQQWIVAAALATRWSGPPSQRATHGGDRIRPAETAAVASTDELVATACAVADRVLATAYGRDPRNWIGVQPVLPGTWLVLPMGAGLDHGWTGVALFLAVTARCSGRERYAEAARHALLRTPQVLGAVDEDTITAVGPGAHAGWGGIAYALARSAALLRDPDLGRWAGTAAGLAARAGEQEPHPGWADGLAGGAVAVHATAQILGERECRAAAARLTDGLRALPVEHRGPDTDWAIAVTDDDPDAVVGAPDLRWWCGHPLDPSSPSVGDAPVESAALSLCHGGAARIDLQAGPSTLSGLRRWIAPGLPLLRERDPPGATPGAVPTAALLTGAAGVGYSLLRLADPHEVPSLLRFDPGPPVPRSTTARSTPSGQPKEHP